ncbi:MAG: hypothetical protein LBQ54_11115 [Planctomycetaceae bacterium]|nr:hypothetical protein [Planctomycetaceae bacterium]
MSIGSEPNEETGRLYVAAPHIASGWSCCSARGFQRPSGAGSWLSER